MTLLKLPKGKFEIKPLQLLLSLWLNVLKKTKTKKQTYKQTNLFASFYHFLFV